MILLLDSEQRDDEEKGQGEGLTNKYVLYLDADVPSRICIDTCQPGVPAPQFSVYVTSLSLSSSLSVCVCMIYTCLYGYVYVSTHAHVCGGQRSRSSSFPYFSPP